VIGGDALADDPPGDRDELEVDVGDPQLVDLLADLLDQLGAAWCFYVCFKIRHGFPLSFLDLRRLGRPLRLS
jgi:hypothetical protein